MTTSYSDPDDRPLTTQELVGYVEAYKKKVARDAMGRYRHGAEVAARAGHDDGEATGNLRQIDF